VYQKERAASDVRWIQNVTEVENKLKIIWWENDEVRQNPPMLTDSELAKAVKDELYQDLRIIEPFEIKVEAISGHITLEGTVPTFYEKKLAGKDSRDVVGVTWVSNLLKVKSELRPDNAILSDVKFELMIAPPLTAQIIDATVKDGVVTLTGNVDTFYEKIEAEEVAGNVKGVVDVDNEIHVKWSPRFTDIELAKRVESRLKSNWETHWVADQINVSVDKGFVTLSGDVNLWSERQEAARLAYFTDGIRGIENRLTVKGIDYPWNELSHKNSKVNF
jgi:osmotically-inducible protein OsmY